VNARAALLACAFALVGFAVPAASFGDAAVRVQAEGVAPLPPFVPGAPRAKSPDAAELRALRQIALANGIENAVLAHAAQLAPAELRGDEAALRAGLGGNLADFALGQAVLADLGPREAKAKPKPGDPPERPRRPADPVPMEHAWRIEALVDGARVQAALAAAGLALISGADGSAVAELVLEAPYDAPMLAALRARLGALGARSAIPRRYEAQGVTLNVRGLRPELLRERLAADPPAGYAAEVQPPDGESLPIRVRMRAEAADRPAQSANRHPEDLGSFDTRSPKRY
jgi:hypothetical protein